MHSADRHDDDYMYTVRSGRRWRLRVWPRRPASPLGARSPATTERAAQRTDPWQPQVSKEAQAKHSMQAARLELAAVPGSLFEGSHRDQPSDCTIRCPDRLFPRQRPRWPAAGLVAHAQSTPPTAHPVVHCPRTTAMRSRMHCVAIHGRHCQLTAPTVLVAPLRCSRLPWALRCG